MEDAQFDLIADRTLRSLLAALDKLDDLEAELEQGVLTIQFSKGGMAFVVNSHRAARQIWLAADRNAWHFDPSADGASWLSSKPPQQELRVVLGEALSRRLGQPIALT